MFRKHTGEGFLLNPSHPHMHPTTDLLLQCNSGGGRPQLYSTIIARAVGSESTNLVTNEVIFSTLTTVAGISSHRKRSKSFIRGYECD